MFLCMTIIKLAVSFYFMLYDTKEWKFLGYSALILGGISLIITLLWLKESPRFLYEKGQKDNALKVL